MGAYAGSLQIECGSPIPKGCSEASKGGPVNFSLDAPNRSSAWLALRLPQGHAGANATAGAEDEEEIFVRLDPATNRTGDTWHMAMTPPEGFDPTGIRYVWILDPKLDDNGNPDPSSKRIVDPCAKCLDSGHAARWNRRDGPKYSPMAVVPDRRAIYDFDWQGVKSPGYHLKDLVIYEAHLRGFTRNPDSKLTDWDSTAGTFTGFIEKIPYLKQLGINCVEFLPMQEFDETACPLRNPQNNEQLCNYWGYSSVSFYVPMQRFSSTDRCGAAIVGFKTLVRELHRVGIEVLLDVVFNHTAEGTWGEKNWHSLAAIAKSRYYILNNGKDTNYTGCGNTVNANDSMCSDWIIDCLKYWVNEMHVDGFRFDLASALTRGGDGKVSMNPLLIRKIAQEPDLKDTKMIAEPWDCSWPDGYLVGKFPSCGPPRWAEWNGQFRDTVRCFIKGDAGLRGDFATRICGSSDLFQHNGRSPFHSINFITAHDGFTLKDLVSYSGKHNVCNGENGRDGDDRNNSWNCGAEGESGDGGIKKLRERQMRNLLVALFMSAGTPMMVFGDEYGRSQRGCNNGWCQDSLGWFSWSDCEREEGKLLRFTRLLIKLRKTYSEIFNRTSFMSGQDIWWRVHMDDPYNYMCYVLHDRQAQKGYSGLLVAFNAGHEVRTCELPEDKTWWRIIDTNLPSPKDIVDDEASCTKITSRTYVMQPYSCIVLKTHSYQGAAKDYQVTDAEYSAHQDITRHVRAVIQRRMSMEFVTNPSNSAAVEENAMERARSMARTRSIMSGTILRRVDADGNEFFTMERPGDVQEEAPAPTFRPPSRDLAPKLPPERTGPVEAEKPAAAKGTPVQVLAHDSGEGCSVEGYLHPTTEQEQPPGVPPAGMVLEIVAKGFGDQKLIFHWGCIEAEDGAWKHPPKEVLETSSPGPSKAIPGAAQTLFGAADAKGFRRVFLTFPGDYCIKAVKFVVHEPPNAWHKLHGQDFVAAWPKAATEFEAAVERVTAECSQGATTRITEWTVRDFRLLAVSAVGEAGVTVHFITDVDRQLMLHCGPGDNYNKWIFARSVDFQPATEEGVSEVVTRFSLEEATKRLMFVLKLPGNMWVKDGAHDFIVWLPEDEKAAQLQAASRDRVLAEEQARAEKAREKAEEAARQAAAKLGAWNETLTQFRAGRAGREKAADVCYHSLVLSEDAGDVDVSCRTSDNGFAVTVTALMHPEKIPASGVKLHWGSLADHRRKDWHCPPEDMMPNGSKIMDAKACQTPMQLQEDCTLRVELPMTSTQGDDGTPVPSVAGMAFVVHVPEWNLWLKQSDGRDCVVMFGEAPGAVEWKGSWKSQVSLILESERDWGHMTLMHRYNNCKGMIDGWKSQSQSKVGMERLPSFGAVFRGDAQRNASWSRLPSSSLLIDEDETALEDLDDELWSWIFVWQRFSYMRLLDWQRNYNTKPRELAAATDGLADTLCFVWKEHANVRLWARWTLATLGRGGNQGQQIRDEILHIMHRNKIPEVAGHFYEQWHQKLHNNTTPDDVGICKALLAFLRSQGNMSEYWKVLADHGITKERLASYDRRIDKEPYLHGNNGQLIIEFENYLRILQSVHDALDLVTAIEAAKWCLPNDLLSKLQDIAATSGGGMKRSRSMGNLSSGNNLDGSHSRFMKLADARLSLLAVLNDKKTPPPVIRQLLLLDYSLETQQSVIVQGTGSETRLPVLCEQMQALLTSIVGHMPLHGELRALLIDWIRLSPDCASLHFGENATESALMLKAMCDRLSRVIGEQVDTFQNLLAPKAQLLGATIGTAKQVLDVFVDEVLRGSALFSLSLVLKRLEPQLRSIAHLPPWQMISAVDRPVKGELVAVDRMLHMQDKIFETPTILLSGAVSGEEEVPVGVQAVLVKDAASAPDILSHCAVRARNSGVLLATCFDPGITEQIQNNYVGQWVEVTCKQDGSVEINVAERPQLKPAVMRKLSRTASRDLTQEAMTLTDDTKLVNMNLTEDHDCKWVVTPDEMDKEQVGSKSLNLALLMPKLPKEVRTPQAVALPYGCMQKTLTSSVNSKVWLPKLEACLTRLQPTTSNEDAREIFEEAQVYINKLQMSKDLEEALAKAMEEVGAKDGEKRLAKLYNKREAWEATKQVWASLFGLRPWVSLAKAGRSFHHLNMAVLVQELLPAKYAFVLHTENPFTHDRDEVYGEVVPGRGETLVGNYPGRALSFRAKRGQKPVVSAFLSKSTWLRTQECLIFRSDSNGEDLEGFAGAGLFESICAKSDIPCLVKFHRFRLITDKNYRQTLLSRLAEVGRQVEEAFGGAPQDIEGCVDPQDRIFIVQSRPQV
eukprot:TRINITY_DN32012_c0_g1_i1.p1 TRINITY_DN32012_c0_g1~~TRINITY_DN32012_c0_g1_i1.p1  ORF type:complete len:2307 (+),score=411.66 TRINITY_DN32012_c0_g1_i1:130-7050(+)